MYPWTRLSPISGGYGATLTSKEKDSRAREKESLDIDKKIRLGIYKALSFAYDDVLRRKYVSFNRNDEREDADEHEQDFNLVDYKRCNRVDL